MNKDAEPILLTFHLYSDHAPLRFTCDTMLHGILHQRFDGERGYRIALSFPSSELRGQMWDQFAEGLQLTTREIELLSDLSEGFSGSDIHEVCMRLQRRTITTREHPKLKDAFPVLQNMSIGEGEGRRFLSRLRGIDTYGIATEFRQRNPKLYSHSALADLLEYQKRQRTAGLSRE